MVDDGQQIDWWEIEKELDRKHPSIEVGKGNADRWGLDSRGDGVWIL